MWIKFSNPKDWFNSIFVSISLRLLLCILIIWQSQTTVLSTFSYFTICFNILFNNLLAIAATSSCTFFSAVQATILYVNVNTLSFKFLLLNFLSGNSSHFRHFEGYCIINLSLISNKMSCYGQQLDMTDKF